MCPLIEKVIILVVNNKLENITWFNMVPTDHDIPFSRTFQGLLRYLFKDFSRTFLCSFKHPFEKNDQQWTFQIRHTETIWSWVRQKNGGGGGILVYVFLKYLDDLLYYMVIIQPQIILLEMGVWGSSTRNFFMIISTKSCNSRQFWRIH